MCAGWALEFLDVMKNFDFALQRSEVRNVTDNHKQHKSKQERIVLYLIVCF